MNGRFRPGEKLTDQGLAELLGISRTPVREAVRQLVKEGLLIGAPNRSVMVFSPSARDVAEIYAIRSSLEGMAAGLAALNPNRFEYLGKMTELVEQARSAAQRDGKNIIAKKNTEFHGLLIMASGCESLEMLLGSIKERAMMCRLSSLQNQINAAVSIREHEEIINCVKDGDGIKAERLVRSHVMKAGKRLLEQLELGKLPREEPIFRLYEVSAEDGGRNS